MTTLRDPRRDSGNDPVLRTRTVLMSDQERLMKLEAAIEQEVSNALSSALEECVV